MKLKFKHQQFQTDAARAVTDVFHGQRNQSMLEFTHDMGRRADGAHDLFDMVGFRNQPVTVPAGKLLENIREIQMPAQLRPSETIDTNDLRLTIEMETDTGKTYTYIKTMFELNRLYGWSKFIIVVPSIAIREGVSRLRRGQEKRHPRETQGVQAALHAAVQRHAQGSRHREHDLPPRRDGRL